MPFNYWKRNFFQKSRGCLGMGTHVCWTMNGLFQTKNCFYSIFAVGLKLEFNCVTKVTFEPNPNDWAVSWGLLFLFIWDDFLLQKKNLVSKKLQMLCLMETLHVVCFSCQNNLNHCQTESLEDSKIIICLMNTDLFKNRLIIINHKLI